MDKVNWVCPMCGEVFETVEEYVLHVSSHSKEIKENAEKKKKEQLEIQKSQDKKNLEMLAEEAAKSVVKYIKACEEYEKKYNGTAIDSRIESLLDLLFGC